MMWLARLFRRRELDRTLDRELADHLARRVADLESRGVDTREALRVAKIELGGVDQVKEACRDVRGTGWVHDLFQDIRYSIRIVRRNPGFAATVMVCLGLGIGVNTSVFSWLDEMYFQRLAVPEPDRVVSITRAGGPGCSYRDFREIQGIVGSLRGLSAIIPKGTFLDIDRINDQIYAEAVSANYFDTLSIQPQLGRSLLPSDESPASEPVAVLSHAAWQRHLRGDAGAIGKAVRIEDQWYRIVGVTPPSFRGSSAPLAIDAWVPLATYPHYRAETARGSAGPLVSLIGRLASNSSVRQAQAEISVADSRMRQRAPGNPRLQTPMQVQHITGYAWLKSRRRLQPVAALLTAVAGIILLIACVNVASLLLARSAAGQREAALRQALGARRGRLLRQGITEGLVLAMGGATMGLGLGYAANRAISGMLPAAHPDLAQQLVHLNINWRVAMFTAAISILCAVLFSVSPALANAKADMTPALKNDGAGRRPGGSGFLPRWKLRDMFVTVQVALSLVLLISACLLIRALGAAQNTDSGFATANRLYVRLFTPENDFSPGESTALFGRMLEGARLIPGVRDVTLSFAVFGFMDGDCASTSSSDAPRKLNINVIEPNYFRFLEIPVLRGRTFSPADRSGAPRVIVVNETMAKRWWPNQDPIGKTAWLGCKTERMPAEVVGIVKDSKYETLDEEPRPFYFVHWRQVWWNGFFALMVNASGDFASTSEQLLALTRQGGPNLRVYEVRSLEDLLALSLVQIKWQATLLGAFSLLAIALAIVGLHGVVAFAVTQRTREIGVRMALGAGTRDVLGMILAHTFALTGLGVALGVLLSAMVTHLLRRYLFGVSPLDATAFLVPALFWVAIGLAASYGPAQRAAQVDPVLALRHD